MARGAQSKSKVMEKILNTFEGAFLYNDGKEVRIPLQEDGEDIQIKVTLTAAKDNVYPGEDNVVPGIAAQSNEINFEDTIKNQPAVQPTALEKENVQNLLKSLGL